MSHRWHLESSVVGCLPDGRDTFQTKKAALSALKFEIDEVRLLGFKPTGSLKSGYFSDGPARLFIERCDDPTCEWEDDV